MNSAKSIKKNYIFNVTYQMLLIILPIITTPYVSRVLGVDGIGKYSFANSIISYFVLFAALGFGVYAQREIAKYQDNKNQQSIIFWEIIIIRTISVIITLAIYFLTILFNVYQEENKTIMIILALNIINVGFDVSFLFMGNEDFLSVVVRGIIIRILGVVAIFVFVKTKEDLWIYVLLSCASALLSNISLLMHIPSIICRVKFNQLKPIRHLRPAIILFLPTIAVSIYTSLDKTMIGIITGSDVENGYYEQAEKIVKMIMTIITSLGTVMIPRNSNAFQNKDYEQVNQNIQKSIKFVFFLGLPMAIGLFCVASNLIPWFLGDGYQKSIILMQILSFLILIIGLSNVFGLQFLVPSGQDKKYTIAIICGAVVNFTLNIILIKLYQSIGAAIATIVAELVVTIVMFGFSKNNISVNGLGKSIIKYIFCGVVMGIVCYILQTLLFPSILNSFLLVCVGSTTYLVLMLVLRDEFTYNVVLKICKKLFLK